VGIFDEIGTPVVIDLKFSEFRLPLRNIDPVIRDQTIVAVDLGMIPDVQLLQNEPHRNKRPVL